MNKVNLLRTVLHCVQAFTFDKTTSTSTTKFKCRCKFGKPLIRKKSKHSRVKGLGNSITKTLAHANSFNLAERQQFKVFLEVAPTLVF